jgi:hypothetical protein
MALKDAGAKVVLVERQDYPTYQPLLYQLATGLLETIAVGHSLRDLLERQENSAVRPELTLPDHPEVWGRRLGRIDLHAPARRTDHRRERVTEELAG